MTSPSIPQLSIVIPAHDEEDNVQRLLAELAATITQLDRPVEVIVVDDASQDATLERLQAAMDDYSWLRVLHFDGTRPLGQSAAFRAGIRAASGTLVAMMDADLQNDPADLPDLLATMQRTGADLVQGDRSHARCDTAVRRVTSATGRFARRVLVGDRIRDTGCSLRLMTHRLALELPLEYRGLHRFIPECARQIGATVVEVPVNHRPRHAGQAKYGILNRGPAALVDCLGVRWLAIRRRRPVAQEVVSPGRELVGTPEVLAAGPSVEIVTAAPVVRATAS